MPDARASRFCAAFAEWAIIHLSETECNSFFWGENPLHARRCGGNCVGFNVMSTEALKGCQGLKIKRMFQNQ